MNWLLLLIAILGVVPFLLVCLKRYNIRKLLQTGEKVTGEVEAVEQKAGLKGAKYYRAVVRYPVSPGKIQRGVYIFSSSRKLSLLRSGQPIELVFRRDQPEKFILTGIPRTILPFIITLLLAVGMGVTCYLLYDFINKGN